MAGSDRHDEERTAPGRRHLSLRLRLTLLYGACFLVAGAAVLAITYVLVAHDTSGQAQSLAVRGAEVKLPVAISLSSNGGHSGTGTSTAGTSTARTSTTNTTTARSGTSTTGATTTATSGTSTAGRSATHATTTAKSGRTTTGTSTSSGAGSVIPPSAGAGTIGPESFVCRNVKTSTLLRAINAARDDSKHDDAKGITPSQLKRICAIRADAQTQVNLFASKANSALKLQRRESLSALLTWSGSALGALAVISILLGWLLAGRALRPLRTMTTKAQEISAENLHERLAVNVRDDELGALANTFDELLARLELAFESQKRFVANASHELRTPLTLERTLLEVALADPAPSVDSLRRVCERVVASTEQQERLIEALLMLARSQQAINLDARLDLANVAAEAINEREHDLAAIAVTTDLKTAPIKANATLVERLVANLLENAICHNRAESPWIKLETGTDAAAADAGGAAWIRVSNSGAVISPEVLPTLFEPFRRLGADRTSSDTGFGLGLSIGQSVAAAHHAVINATAVDGGGLSVEVRFEQAHEALEQDHEAQPQP